MTLADREHVLAARLRQARTRCGLTQEDLAQRAGVRVDTLRSIEQGRTSNPGVFTVAALASVLGVAIEQLLADVDHADAD